MALDLQIASRPLDKFHLEFKPLGMTTWGWDWLLSRVAWQDAAKDTYFVSWQFAWFFRWYHGKMKIDGTRTNMYWWGQTGTDYTAVPTMYVMNTWSKELFSFRIRNTKSDRRVWTNQGGI